MFEHVGGETFSASVRAVRTGGRIVTCGATAGAKPEIDLRHVPPAGALGTAVAALFRRDPRHQLADDLVRAKTFLETGHRSRDARRPARTLLFGCPSVLATMVDGYV